MKHSFDSHLRRSWDILQDLVLDLPQPILPCTESDHLCRIQKLVPFCKVILKRAFTLNSNVCYLVGSGACDSGRCGTDFRIYFFSTKYINQRIDEV